jgi:hypothetical protein
MSTQISVIVQKFDKRGDQLGLPTILYTDRHRFDTDAQADTYFQELENWIDERPIPDIDIHPFPRAKMRDPMDIVVIIDEMFIPEMMHL